MRRETVVIDADTAPVGQLRNGRGSVVSLVDPRVGAENVDVHINTITAGSAPGPYHLHERAENVYYVFSGDGLLRADGKSHALSAGNVAFIPPGVPHSMSNVGESDLRLLEIYAPAGADFVEVEEPPEGDR